ncbi:hypothetical protein HPHPP2B_0132 [Helicobacter pylori Hp P-2b]|uniref:Uncharacterized protein n=1 Tax=Helicobacter pylori Hp P-2 TaxID=992073 RepID=I9W0A2_HELPX|nr:hypothetical protein HPHPP2_0131 [Helicobacter pylori Hp P-2]EJC57355.1 hypothetical protein HPHPP2B_0132 [Helicobacter pylori Hp P-2b]
MSAKINRGDCTNNEGFPYFKINKTLKFGDSYQFYILRCQHIKEVSIKTDKGLGILESKNQLAIISKTDSIKIQNIQFNRGKCLLI